MTGSPAGPIPPRPGTVGTSIGSRSNTAGAGTARSRRSGLQRVAKGALRLTRAGRVLIGQCAPDRRPAEGAAKFLMNSSKAPSSSPFAAPSVVTDLMST